jgi:hypothetical protein
MARNDNADQYQTRDTTTRFDKMFKLDSTRGSKGVGFIVLNVIRSINVIVLLALITSCGALIFFAGMPGPFTLFQDFSLVALVGLCCIMTYSELPIPWGQNLLKQVFPVFNKDRV